MDYHLQFCDANAAQTPALMAAALLSKEVTEWTVYHVFNFINRLRHFKVMIKADHEHATNELIHWVCDRR